MPFEKGKSGNPKGRPLHRLADGRTLAQLAREHTEEAVETLVSVMRDVQAPAAARVAAADRVLSRGWGQAPQTVTIADQTSPRDMSELSDDQLAALETLGQFATLAGGAEGHC